MYKYICNPFFIYAFIFIFILILYPLQWSYIQRDLTVDTLSFILSTVVVSIFFGIFYIKFFKKNSYVHLYGNTLIWFAFIAGILAEFGYNRGIPLVSVVRGEYFDYFNFGIPTFHAFFIPYITCSGLISFYRFLNKKILNDFLLFVVPVIFSLCIINRGMLVFYLLSSLIIYLIMNKNITLKKVFFTFFGLFISLYIFGWVGNHRMISSGYQGDDIILKVGQATPNFYSSNIPSEFFWSYLYLITPFANLQYKIDNLLTSVYIINVFKYHLLIDFIQKRLFVDDNYNSLLISEELNVSTMYGDIIQSSGFFGGYVVFFWYLFVVYIVTLFTPKKYRIIAIALFCSISILQSFANVITVAGYGFPPVLLALLTRFNFKGQRII